MTNLYAVMVGDAGVGKSRFVNMLSESPRVRPYVPTMGSPIHPIAIVDTGAGVRSLMVVDVGCSPRFAQLRPAIYLNAMVNGFVDKIIVAHSGSPQKWYDEIRTNFPDVETLDLDMRTVQTYDDAKAWIGANIGKYLI
jgi:GTPase SAR1 family protein